MRSIVHTRLHEYGFYGFTGSTAHVGLRLYGYDNKSERYYMHRLGAFHRASVDTMIVATNLNLGELWRIQIWHDNYGLQPAWYLKRVIVRDLQTNKKYHFVAECWLSLTHHDQVIGKKINAAGNSFTYFKIFDSTSNLYVLC